MPGRQSPPVAQLVSAAPGLKPTYPAWVTEVAGYYG